MNRPEAPAGSSAQTPNSGADRPLPFVVRVAAEWIDLNEATETDDGAIFFRDRARLTGQLMFTCRGADVQFSDVGVTA